MAKIKPNFEWRKLSPGENLAKAKIKPGLNFRLAKSKSQIVVPRSSPEPSNA